MNFEVRKIIYKCFLLFLECVCYLKMSSANCQLTSYNIKLPAYKVFNTTEKAICGARHSTARKEEERGDSEEGELD